MIYFCGHFFDQSANISFQKITVSYALYRNFKLFCMLQKIFPFASSLIHNVGHQAEISLDEDIAGFFVALGCQGQVVAFFLGGQGLWEGAGG